MVERRFELRKEAMPVKLRKSTNLIALVVAIFLFTAAAQAVTIDVVSVGNPGNPADTTLSGSVTSAKVALTEI